MNLTPLQQKVFDRAKEQLKEEPWFNGVCTDNFPTDEDIERKGVEDSAVQVIMNTAYWDGPTTNDLGIDTYTKITLQVTNEKGEVLGQFLVKDKCCYASDSEQMMAQVIKEFLENTFTEVLEFHTKDET